PTLFGAIDTDRYPTFARQVGAVWLALGAAGLIARTLHLFIARDVATGLVWMTKILTDPFHDIKLYYKAPPRLLRGELIDPRHRRGQQWATPGAGGPSPARSGPALPNARSVRPRPAQPGDGLAQHPTSDAASRQRRIRPPPPVV